MCCKWYGMEYMGWLQTEMCIRDRSDRQIEVMRMLYDGKNDSEIAEKLFISLNTVNNHRKNSFRKVGVHSMAEFMRYAMTNNLFK